MKTKINFKNWVEKHNPNLQWDWNNPKEIKRQLCCVIEECGNLELKNLFSIMFVLNDSGLTKEQTEKFLKETY